MLKLQEWVKATGEKIVVLFEGDRSWYNRAGVERVMGFCTPNDYLEFMRQAPQVEQMIVRSGVRLFKYWYSVTREEQLRRFKSRENEQLKKWKLSPIDLQSLDKWDDYTEAKEAMFFYTDTADRLIIGSSADVIRNNQHILGSSLHPEQRKSTSEESVSLAV